MQLVIDSEGRMLNPTAKESPVSASLEVPPLPSQSDWLEQCCVALSKPSLCFPVLHSQGCTQVPDVLPHTHNRQLADYKKIKLPLTN